MDEYFRHSLEELKLRGLIAFTARCARRVFPIVVLADHAVRECDNAIAMAEAFAAGEPGSLIQARRVAKAAEDGSLIAEIADDAYPRTPQQNSWHARHAAIEVAKATVSAFSAITRTPPSEPCCQKGVEHAKHAYHYAMTTIEPFGERRATDSDEYRQFEQKHPKQAQEAQWARDALKHDLETLQQSHHGTVTELGLAVDTSARGPLGPLWCPKQVPDWYKGGLRKWRKPHGIVVEAGEKFLHDKQRGSQFPNLVCWHLANVTDETELEKLKESLQAVQKVSGGHSRPPPGLVVYAPGIAEDKRSDLIRLGAIVYADPLVEECAPRDADSLCAMLQDRLEENYEGWEKDDQGFWLYVGSRIAWRDNSPRPMSVRAERPKQMSTKESKKRELATKDEYWQLLGYLQANEW